MFITFFKIVPSMQTRDKSKEKDAAPRITLEQSDAIYQRLTQRQQKVLNTVKPSPAADNDLSIDSRRV